MNIFFLGDLGAPEALFVPQILATFSEMWEQGEMEICDVWTDLIEYVIQKFITTMGTRPHDCASNLLECIQDSKISEAVDENGFTKSQLESLHSYYAQVAPLKQSLLLWCFMSCFYIENNSFHWKATPISSLPPAT